LIETIFWQCSTEGYEVLFQGNFANVTHTVGGICDSSRRKIIGLN